MSTKKRQLKKQLDGGGAKPLIKNPKESIVDWIVLDNQKVYKYCKC